MTKKVIIVHGWDGSPHSSWKSWLAEELRKKNFEVIAPQLPGGEHPRLEDWLQTIHSVVGEIDEHTYFVGHSLGTITVAKFLETLPSQTKVGGCLYVSGFCTDIGFEEIFEFTAKPLDVDCIRTHTTQHILLHSDDDDVVPLQKAEEFANIIGGKLILEHNKGHYTTDDGVVEIPILLQSILSLSEE